MFWSDQWGHACDGCGEIVRDTGAGAAGVCCAQIERGLVGFCHETGDSDLPFSLSHRRLLVSLSGGPHLPTTAASLCVPNPS